MTRRPQNIADKYCSKHKEDIADIEYKLFMKIMPRYEAIMDLMHLYDFELDEEERELIMQDTNELLREIEKYEKQ